MRKNKNTLIKFAIMAIFMIISIMIPKNVLATNSKLKCGDKLSVTELWNKAGVWDIYCTDHTNHLANNETYTVSEVWEVEGNTVMEDGIVVNKKSNYKKWKTAMGRAYIISSSGPSSFSFDSLNVLGNLSEGQERCLKHGIYSVLDYKQEALWRIGTYQWNWVRRC